MAEGAAGERTGAATDERFDTGAPPPAAMDHEALDGYVRRLFAREERHLRAIRRRAAEAGLPAIQLPPATARVMQILLGAVGARRVLEVGTLGGYSAAWIARALPPDGEVLTLEVDPRRAEVARRSLESAGLGERVTVRVGDAKVAMEALRAARPFDAVFLDADKERYPEYLKLAVRIARPGGLLLADNAFWRGRVVDAERAEGSAAEIRQVKSINRFNEMVAARDDLDATIVPVGDGLLVALVGEYVGE